METNESTEGSRSRSRSLDIQPSSEGLGPTSEPFPSSDDSPRSALAAATAAAAAAASAAAATAAFTTAKAAALSTKTPAPCSEFMEPSSDPSLLGEPCAGPGFTHNIAHGSLGFEPVYVSCIAQDTCTTTDHSSNPGPVPGSSSGPVLGSSSGAGHGSGSGSGPGCGSVPGSGSGPGPGSGPGSGPGHGSGSHPGPASGPGPDTGPDSELSPCIPPGFRNLVADRVPNYTSWSQHCPWEPQKQPPWEFLQVLEPGARGLWKPPDIKGKLMVCYETLPRGQCLLYNWEEERATNHLDQVPSMQDGSESFFFRHGHRGLLTMQLKSPMPSSTTQKDSYQPPGNVYWPLRGKREAMLEMLLQHQICKEVQAEQEPTRKLFEVESVTHHDYRMELAQAGTPAPTKPHDYRQEQPETFWIQRAPQLPGVSNIRTLDTPFRKNCSFSTPVPLSLGKLLPYEPENYPYQLGEISSLPCPGGRLGGGGGRMTPF
ncbi:sperm associated antigen 8 [Homo sapiens]|uniref:Sperm-associated antigen 8 n=2 Tax=Homo sapiens TaxID=9606 RepID=SPAG8_HUMAN|nr:sperm-associated antigen 8 isoform 1 [Homo sapiens]Q99932.3 RecName: Full=Sperm-associated antigen 8; AltName: Full=HSD-1; AltName: Full=Sperm membrane protein 1; Short=SMP-1; AltName: Full=Sperm membrane protein BS-84 [Homo sapiens]7UNG_D Chain D, Sperm-associated antigen 8 [Homo sapiens]8J07_5H Chain 5H, Sperm-associated antigen 8 [Homo sapiens]8J07_5I Chain 5I, Sperm-associated antigen 8 [Homo sapiens]8J07_5J Chain 5J, Sperm-associated antigen 8 [Homo sapiens]AEE61087.1 testicular tissu|eukprot:NP_001034681.1 sperm-associated antigen 8 isoform 1 [Homo sapiens]